MAASQTINIALLDTDTPVPSVLSTRGYYSTIFRTLLESALTRISKTSLINGPVPKLNWSVYNVVEGDYPSDLSTLDAVVLSGSAASVYDSDPWISVLHTWLHTAHALHPGLKFFGSCFGHQILCSALSPPSASSAAHQVVTRNPAGWELGVLPVALSPAFLAAFPVDVAALPSAPPRRGDASAAMRLQMVHADHVVVPQMAAAGWCGLGATPRCGVQGVYGARLLTLQGHFEFDRFVNGETIKVFGAGWGEEALREALEKVDADDDAAWAAEVVVAFLVGLGERERGLGVGRVVGEAVVRGGLMTPPEEVV